MGLYATVAGLDQMSNNNNLIARLCISKGWCKAVSHSYVHTMH